MARSNQYDITRLALTDEEYVVEQSLFRNKYEVTDMEGAVVLKGKQKMLKMKEEFPFVDGGGEEVFTVKADSVLDVAGSYTLVDAATDEAVVVLDEELSLFVEDWKIRDPETEDVLARVESKNKLASALRTVSDYARLIPNKYEIFDGDGEKVGEIAGEFSIKDRYTVSIGMDADVPREAVMAAACVLDALENR